MNSRRMFLKSLASFFAVLNLRAGSSAMMGPIDRYGGLKSMRFKASSFFRTEWDGDRWWLVTPEGHAFISFGVNHYHASWWAQDHNRAYWVKRFQAKRPFDAQWNEGFKKVALGDLRRLGINSLGIHTDAPMLTEPPGRALFPYVAEYSPLKLSHYLKPKKELYLDVFSHAFRVICDKEAKKSVLPYANDPMILGFCMADCPIFTDDEAEWFGSTTWPRQIRNLGEDAPGKKVYVDLLAKTYPSIEAFNRVYRTRFQSWDELFGAKNWREDVYPKSPKEKADNERFLLLCVDEYYKRAKEAFRKYNPNHLFFGDKINGNTNGMDSVLAVTSRYTDCVNFQYYAELDAHKKSMDRWSRLKTVDQPILNGDSAFTVPTETMPNPFGPHCKSQGERARMTLQYMQDSLLRKDFVGWHMCGIIDTIKTMPSKEYNQHQGLMTIKGDFYSEMEAALKRISENLYAYASR